MSKLIETRAEFQQLAQERLEEAKVLLDAGKWSGAYYLAGYAVELALKACIIKMLLATDAFPDKEFSRNCYTHSVEKLVPLARLESIRSTARNADPILSANWEVAEAWSENKRYHQINQAEAEGLYVAITDAAHGVFPWITTCW